MTIQKSTGKAVQIKEIASIKNGKMTLRLEDGSEVDAADVQHGSESAVIVYEAMASLEGFIDGKSATDFADHLMDLVKRGEPISDTFVDGIRQAYLYGYSGYGPDSVSDKNTDASLLTERQRNVAYSRGKKYAKESGAAERQRAEAKQKAGEKGTKAPDGKTYKNVRFEGRIKKWGDKQRADVAFLDFVAREFAGDVTVHVFESWKESNGKRYYRDSKGKIHTAPNGKYIKENGDIYIDLSAGDNGEGLVMNTFAHELYHHIEKWSPAKARQLAEFLVKELGLDSVEAMVKEQIKKAEAAGHGVKYFMMKGKSKTAAENIVRVRAFSDFVADSLETVFNQGNAMEILQRLRKSDKGLFNRIKNFVNKWVSKLREFYQGNPTISLEGHKASQLEKFEQIQELFMEALVDAGENFKNADTVTTEENIADGTVMFMERGIESVTDETVKEDLTLIFNGHNVSAKSYIPLSKTTPFAVRYIAKYTKDLPIIIDKKKAYFDMRESGKFKEDSGHHYHGMGVDGFLDAIDILHDPEFAICEQMKNGDERYAFISTNEYGEEICIVFEMAVYKTANVMNGYPSGYYNLNITEFIATDEWLENHGVEPGTTYKDYLLSFYGNYLVYDRNIHRDQLEKARNTDVGSAGLAASHINNRASGIKVTQPDPEVKKNPDEVADFSDRNPTENSNRSLLVNALESTAQNDWERKKLQAYKDKIQEIEEDEQKLLEAKKQIYEMSFSKGPRDAAYKEKLRNLRTEALHAQKRLDIRDNQLLRLEASKPLQDLLKREKDKAYKKAVDKHTAAKKKALDETRENIAKRDAKTKLQRLVLETVRWISHPSKTDVKCPDLLKPAYSDFLNSIDMSSKRLAEGGKPTVNDLRLTNAMDSLATALERISAAQDPSKSDTKALDIGYLDLPVDYIKTLREMTEKIKKTMTAGDYVINNMSAAQIRKLSQMIRTLNHSIKEMSKLYTTMRFSNVHELGGETMSFMDELGDIKKSGGAKDFVTWDNALPYYAFKRFGKGGEAIFEGLMDAQDKEAFLGKVILDFSQKTWNEKEAKAWSEDTHTIELPNGNKLTLTSTDAMGIYCLSKRPQGLKHLLGGGIRVIGIQKGSKKSSDSRSLLTLKDIDAICATLSDRQVAVADAIQSFMSTVCAEWGNEISMKRFLTQEFTEQTYYPIESNDENLPTKDPAAQQSDLFRLLNISATKDLDKNANNEVIIRNIFDVFSSHASDMARLNAYGMALLDYMKWLNYRVKTTNSDGQIEVAGVRKSMEQAYGKAAGSYVLNLIKDVNGRPSDGGDPGFLMRQLRNAKTASVGNSLRVATLQVTSYPRASLVLSTKSLVLGLKKRPQIEKAKKYCGIALWKSFGFYDTNISRSIEEQIKGTKNVRQKLIELSLKGAEWGDAITWGALWNACEYEVAATKKYDVGSEAFNQAVAKKLREVVYRTQVVDSVLTRSQMMRSKRGMAQEASAFMSEPTLQANILMDASFEFNLEKRRTGSVTAAWKKCGKQIRKAVAVYSVGQLASTLLESLWDAWRDDDDEAFWEKFKAAFGKNIVLNIIPFNKVPIISDICEAVLAMFGVGYFSSDKLSSTWISQTVSAVDAWKDVFSGDSSMTAYNALYKSCRAVSSYFGVSGSGAMREVVALWNNTAGAFDSTWKIRQYDLSKTELGEQLYDAIIEGDADQEESLRAEFEDEESMTTALRKALRENDPRIQDAAKARQSMDTEEYLRIVEEIVDQGFFSEDDVVAAVRSVYNNLKGDDSHQKLYNAMLADDEATVEEVKGNYINDKGKFSDTSYHNAIRKGLRENEPRIKKAAEAKANGDTDAYLEIVEEIVDEGHFKWKDVSEAVKDEVKEMKED